MNRSRYRSVALLSLLASLIGSLTQPAQGRSATPPAGRAPFTRSWHVPSRSTAVNGPLLVLDQRGSISAQVQIIPQHDEILAVVRGHVTHVLARGLTTYTCCAGLAPSPKGRAIAFSQAAAHPKGRTIPTKGLWLTTSSGQHRRLLLRPPLSSRPDAPFDITAVSWSPNRATLAYAVNLYTDTPVASALLTTTGLWLARYDAPQPHQVFALGPLGRTIPALAAACGPIPLGPTINAVSWASDARTIVVSVECQNPRMVAIMREVVLAVDTITRQARVLVTGGRDAAFSPAVPRLAYVTGRADGRSPMTLWVADAQGHHSRKLLTKRGYLSSPTWSPNGRRIAYLVGSPSVGTGVTTIHTVDVATALDRSILADNQRGQPLLPVGGHFTRLAWMPASPPARAAVAHPSLSFTCTEAIRTGVICHLAGHGFAPHERVRITYVVSVSVEDLHRHQSVMTTYRRTTMTDGHGSFVRHACP